MEREQSRKKYVKKLSLTVELAYQKDPRVTYFRDLDKKHKQDQKERKKLEKQRLVEEREAKERQKQEAIEAERQRQAEEEKKQAQEKQKIKKQLQAGRKRLRDLVQSKSYFTNDEAKQLQIMEGVERVCMNFSIEDLTDITDKLTNVTELASALELLSIRVSCFLVLLFCTFNDDDPMVSRLFIWTNVIGILSFGCLRMCGEIGN